MKHNSELIFYEDREFAVGISVEYDYEKSPSQIEECHGLHDVGGAVYAEITAILLEIEGFHPIDLLPLLHPHEKEFIKSQLKYYNL